jgi:serine/threonine protein kinase
VSAPPLPQQLGPRYTLERHLGRGAMGTVYLARDQILHRLVTIKVVRKELTDDDARARFAREARSAARLRHPNILSAIDVGEVADASYYVMPYVEGETLSAILDKSRLLPLDHSLDVAIAVASALEYAHSLGIVHRDVKPSNVLIPQEGFAAALLMDFGLQGQLLADTGQTQAGAIFGTPNYMSPEQIRGESQSAKTDIFGVGVLVYEMLYGSVPHQTESLPELIHRRLHEAVTFPDLPAINDELRNLIATCLERDASRRPQTIAKQLRTIKGRDSGLPDVTTVRASTPPRAVDREAASLNPPARPAANPSSPAAAVQSRRSHGASWIPIFAGATAVVVVASAVLVYTSSPLLAQFAVGFGLVVWGVVASLVVTQWLRTQRETLGQEAAQLLSGSRNRAALTQSLAIQVDHLMVRCRTVDERFLGASIALMIDEFQEAKAFDDRQRALVASVDFLEKLTSRLSPWYVRYEKLIAAVVALLGIVPGIYQMVQTLR